MSASADPTEFRAAVEWYAAKTPMSREDWNKLSESARKRAFTVAHVANAELVRGVHDSLTRAISTGQSFEEWKKAAAPEIAAAWGGNERPWHLETIFRTNVQSAYAAGRYAQLTDPDMLLLRPFWMFDAVQDGRTTDECRGLNGTIMPADDPWWEGRIPPLHYNCRSSIRSLRKSEAEKDPRLMAPPPALKGADGFGGKPLVKESELDVDVSKFPSTVAGGLAMKLAQDPDKALPLPPREPPVAIVGPAHGPEAKRGSQWKPGFLKTDPVPLDDDPSKQPSQKLPWNVSEELAPRGPIVTPDGVKKPKDHEFDLDEYLAAQGNHIERRREGSREQSKGFADRDINGVTVEYRSLLPKPTPEVARFSFREAVADKARKRQAEFLIVDVSAAGLSYQEVLEILREGGLRSMLKAFSAVRVVGGSFDVSFDTR